MTAPSLSVGAAGSLARVVAAVQDPRSRACRRVFLAAMLAVEATSMLGDSPLDDDDVHRKAVASPGTLGVLQQKPGLGDRIFESLDASAVKWWERDGAVLMLDWARTRNEGVAARRLRDRYAADLDLEGLPISGVSTARRQG